MAKRGRPSKYTAALALKILTLLSAGHSLRSICDAEGMPGEATVRGWNIDDVDGFSARYARARHDCVYSRLDRAHDRLDDKDAMTYVDEAGNRRVDGGAVQQARAYSDHVRWEASKMIPEFKDKLDIAHSGHIDLAQRIEEARKRVGTR